jgi:hypothetical protein
VVELALQIQALRDAARTGRAHRLEKVGSVSVTAPFENISNNEGGGIASARWFMLPREFSAPDQPFCGTGPDHDRPDIIRARNAGRDRADKCEAHHGNKNENLEPLTERDPSNKANGDK